MARQTITRAALMQWALLAASIGPVAAAEPDKLTKVRFISTVADDLRPFLYALNTGLFKQAGLDIDFQRASTGATVAQAIVGGAMDVGKASISSIIAAYVQGLPFVLIAPGQLYRKDEPTAGVMVAINSPLKTPLDLQGKTIACTALGDITYLGLRSVIDEAGGDSSTVKWVELPMSSVSAALQQGRIDAGLMGEPEMGEEMRAGKVRFFVDMKDGYSRPTLDVVYFTTRDYAAKNRDTVARFAKVIRSAGIYSNSHIAQTIPMLVAATGMDPKVAMEMHHAYVGTTFEPAQIQPIIDLAAKYKTIPHGFDARDMMATVVQ